MTVKKLNKKKNKIKNCDNPNKCLLFIILILIWTKFET